MPNSYLCDLYDDCPGGFDEQNCTTSKSIPLSLYIYSRYNCWLMAAHYSNCNYYKQHNCQHFPVNYVL